MKINEGTKVSTDLKTILSIVAGVAVGVWVYFGIEERLNRLETADTLFQADLLKKAEQEPKNLEMYMLIEHLAGQIESIEKEIEASRYNKVNIDHLKEQVDALQKKMNGHQMELVFALLMYLGDPPVLKEHLLMPSLSECMQRKRISMRSTNNAQFQCMKVNAVIKDGKIISISKSE